MCSRSKMLTSLLLSLVPVVALPTLAQAAQPYMRAHFIDVGQADAILLEFRCGTVLIDAGDPLPSSHRNRTTELTSYLKAKLWDSFGPKNTLDYFIVTHDDSDHFESLWAVFDALKPKLRVRHFIHSDLPAGGGVLTEVAGYTNPDGTKIDVRKVTSEEIMTEDGPEILTDDDMHPIGEGCATCDPTVSILSGRFTERPAGFTNSEYSALRSKDNNQSVVVRVDFGQFSMLLTGDLEKQGLKALNAYYVDEHPQKPNDEDHTMLDVDLYKVGHHGSYNATPDWLPGILTPKVAVVCVGKYNESPTSNYHHPSWSALEDLLSAMPAGGRAAKERKVGVYHEESGETTWEWRTFNKRIYATAWDGTVKVIGREDGTFAVYRNQ